jgi:UDP-N-acetyl-D-mannosaminuronic acid transferase (WecB/TagA/CpsF family)
MPQFKCLLSIAEQVIEKMKARWLYNLHTQFQRLKKTAITHLPLWHVIITFQENKSKHILPITADM